jgi:hypothetical protein
MVVSVNLVTSELKKSATKKVAAVLHGSVEFPICILVSVHLVTAHLFHSPSCVRLCRLTDLCGSISIGIISGTTFCGSPCSGRTCKRIFAALVAHERCKSFPLLVQVHGGMELDSFGFRGERFLIWKLPACIVVSVNLVTSELRKYTTEKVAAVLHGRLEFPICMVV